jgi:hypothetical protein
MVTKKTGVERRIQTFGSDCVLPIVIFATVLYGVFKFVEYQFDVNHMPTDLEVTGILYSNEQNWGSIFLPLPGDNETGVFMYGLSEAIAQKISNEGKSFFYRSENVKRRVGMQRTHSEWEETPMGITLSDYLNQFGFGIKVDPSVEALVDNTISEPGSYYSRGRTGVVIVIPRAKRAIFAYAG